MARKRRCNLCGAKLKGDICPECGYNNAAYNYKINSSEEYCGHSSSEQFYDQEDHQEHTSTDFDSGGAGKDIEESGSRDRWDYSQLEDFDPLKDETEDGADTDDIWASVRGKWDRMEEDAKTGQPNQETVTYGLNTERKPKKKKRKIWAWLLLAVILLPALMEAVNEVFDELSGSGDSALINEVWDEAGGDEDNGDYGRELSEIQAGDNLLENYLNSAAGSTDEESGSGVEGSVAEKIGSTAPGSADAGVGSTASEAADDESGTAAIRSENGTYEMELTSGAYVAGIHFPAGIYDAVVRSGSGSFEADNLETGYWEMEYLKEEGNRQKDLQLSVGTVVTISDTLCMSFSADGELQYLEGEENPLTESVSVEDGMVCGVDFEPGTYDVVCDIIGESWGELLYKHIDSYGEENTGWISFDPEGELIYRNLVLKEGDVPLKLNCDLTLEPSEYDISSYYTREQE